MANPLTVANKVLLKVFGSRNERVLKGLWPLVSRVASHEESFQKLGNEELAGITARFRERLAAGETLDDLLPEAFAAVRESSRRHRRTQS
jgi:preprotein translocase subunit SecA